MDLPLAKVNTFLSHHLDTSCLILTCFQSTLLDIIPCLILISFITMYEVKMALGLRDKHEARMKYYG